MIQLINLLLLFTQEDIIKSIMLFPYEYSLCFEQSKTILEIRHTINKSQEDYTYVNIHFDYV